MTKLKTLKDLAKNNYHNTNADWVFNKQLRQEAIKWIKDIGTKDLDYFELDKLHLTAVSHDSKKDYEQEAWHCGECAKIVWIMNFFNLTEEDLK